MIDLEVLKKAKLKKLPIDVQYLSGINQTGDSVKLLILIEGNNILMCLLTYPNLNKSINILSKLSSKYKNIQNEEFFKELNEQIFYEMGLDYKNLKRELRINKLI